MRAFTHTIRSPALGNERSVWVRLPDDGVPPRHLVIFLDGEIYCEHVGAAAITEQLTASGAIPPALLVYVSAVNMETRSIECPCYPPFAEFITAEFLPWLEHLYPVIRDCRERVLVGLSYTGLAAAYVALQGPNTFTKVIAQSGSFWWNDCWLVDRYARPGTALNTLFYLDVGTQETDIDVDHGHVQQTVSQIDGVQRFRDVLVRSGHTVNYVEFNGGHSAVQWRKTLPGALQWALAR